MKFKYILSIVGITIISLLVVYLIVPKKHIAPNSLGKFSVVTSFYPLYFFTSQIAGDKASVYNITPAGAEPHNYEPSTRDVATIEDSNLVILHGDKLEAWGEKIKDILRGTAVIISEVGAPLASQTVVEEGATIADPHVWLDPVLAQKEAQGIAQQLKNIDPSNAAYYEANLQKLINNLDKLDSQYAQGLKSCAKKDIITSHAAFGYMAKRYRLTQIPISGLSPDAEPSPQQLVDVAEFAKKNGVKYIFFESLVSPKLSQTIANEIGAQTLVLNPIEGLSDQELSAGKTYLTEMQNNLTNLKIALQCQ